MARPVDPELVELRHLLVALVGVARAQYTPTSKDDPRPVCSPDVALARALKLAEAATGPAPAAKQQKIRQLVTALLRCPRSAEPRRLTVYGVRTPGARRAVPRAYALAAMVIREIYGKTAMADASVYTELVRATDMLTWDEKKQRFVADHKFRPDSTPEYGADVWGYLSVLSVFGDD